MAQQTNNKENNNKYNNRRNNNGCRNNKKYNSDSDFKPIADHAVAPYNFVSFPDRSIDAYEKVEDLPGHNSYKHNKEELLSGTIEYDIEAKTPIIISKGNTKNNEENEAHFFKNLEGKHTIPASTVRGLIRTNAAILSMSNISEEIEDKVFSYRDFSKGSLKYDYSKRLGIKSTPNDEGKSYSLLENVFAGYIYKKSKNEYIIIPAKKVNGHSYFRISEMKLRSLNPKVDNVNYMYNKKFCKYREWRKEFIKTYEYNNLKNRIKSSGDLERKMKDKFIKDEELENKSYKAYNTKVSFNPKNKRDIGCIGKPGEYNYEGYLLCSSRIRGKEAHYIINEYDEAKENTVDEIKLTGEDYNVIENYEDDLLRTNKAVDKRVSEQKYNECKKKHEYYYLPEGIGKNNGKPIFYAKFNGCTYIGFTPYLRIYYDHGIKEGISKLYKNNDKISYCDAIFGFSNKKDNNTKDKKDNNISFKSRVSFEDCVMDKELTDKNISKYREFQDKYSFILGEPKASCYPNYVQQEENCDRKKLKNYNSEDFRIRGIKQYWLKDYIDGVKPNNKNKNVSINIFPLKVGSVFGGKIVFKNLKKEELGLLLWALKLEEGCNQNIGLAKPCGFGQIKINNIQLKVQNLQKKYNEISFEEEFTESRNIEEFIAAYKNYSHSINLENNQSIREFMHIKSNVISKKHKNEFRHMSISEKEFAKSYSLPNIRGMLKIIGKDNNDINSYVAVDEDNSLNDVKCVVCGEIFHLNDAQINALNKRGIRPKCNKCKK
ncbi:TIGR03986 family CRISPR-associated RAMP protein [Hathewaya histolytica]|uniref:TIGR03986 family type III CRISPR-associated RAMP protein n=1 Tax=Hathewaya histolytica TaxID=1498 RepID=UPI003B67F2D5